MAGVFFLQVGEIYLAVAGESRDAGKPVVVAWMKRGLGKDLYDFNG